MTTRPYGRAKIFRDCARFGFFNKKMHNLPLFYLFGSLFKKICCFLALFVCAKLLNRNIGRAKQIVFRKSVHWVTATNKNNCLSHWVTATNKICISCQKVSKSVNNAQLFGTYDLFLALFGIFMPFFAFFRTFFGVFWTFW